MLCVIRFSGGRLFLNGKKCVPDLISMYGHHSNTAVTYVMCFESLMSD